MDLSVIISNRNDISMLAVTVRSCIEEFQALPSKTCEVVIADNSDPEVYKCVQGAIPSGYIKDKTVKLLHQAFPCLFSTRELAANNATGKYILCLDSHMLVGHNCFKDLVNFMNSVADDESVGFAHAPICWAHQHESSAKHDRDITKGDLGPWNNQYKTITQMTWKGMPWICRREWFLNTENGIGGYGALSKHQVSWGGGDMHIGTKSLMLGYKNYAIPTRPCTHIGPFPSVDKSNANILNQNKYRLYSKSGNFPHTFGFLLSCYILGGESMIQRNLPFLKGKFSAYLNFDDPQWVAKAKELGEEEKVWLDGRKKYSFEQLVEQKPWIN
jgi:hypothetical protein